MLQTKTKSEKTLYGIFIIAVVGGFLLNSWNSYQEHQHRKLQIKALNRDGIDS